VVLSRKETQENLKINLEILSLDWYNYLTAFRIVFHPSSGLWISATPEQLGKVEYT
jgi:hypothetical protein